jgi:hypothetical protein
MDIQGQIMNALGGAAATQLKGYADLATAILGVLWWYVFGMWIALIAALAVTWYIWSDSASRSIDPAARRNVMLLAGAGTLLVALGPITWLTGLKITWLMYLPHIGYAGMVGIVVTIGAMIYYSTTFKRSAFSTQEWNQLGGALAGIKQSVDGINVPAASPAPADHTVIDTPMSAGPAWGRTVIEERTPGSFASLRVVSGSGVGRNFDLKSEGETRLGRDAALNDIIIDDPKMSSQHAKIRVEGGSYTIFDLGSTNGTKLNGSTVNSPMPLNNQDKVEFGSTALVFQLAQA